MYLSIIVMEGQNICSQIDVKSGVEHLREFFNIVLGFVNGFLTEILLSGGQPVDAFVATAGFGDELGVTAI